MKYLSARQVSEKWGISTQRIQLLCRQGRIPGSFIVGNSWAIPSDANKPVDARIKNGKYTKQNRQSNSNNRKEFSGHDFVFPYFVSFGKMDSVDSEILLHLTAEETDRLIASAKEEPRWRLYEDKRICDIYDRVYNAVIDENVKMLREDPEPVIDALDLAPRDVITDEEVRRYLSNLTIGINFPEELQFIENDLDEEETVEDGGKNNE